MLPGVIEEEVAGDLERDLRFAHGLLTEIDPGGGSSGVVVVAALLGANYYGWRTRAEQSASPNSMNLNISGGERIVAHLTPPSRRRAELADDASAIAEDLMVLLRRAARGR